MIGAGILKGMAVTARNFVGSYFEKDRLITVQYPEERSPLPENYRNFPFLIYDNDAEAGLRCVACKICEKECPPQCIYIIKSEDKKPDYMGKPQFYPATFDIDISVCMSCQICVEVCPFEAIKMDKVFELSRRERFDALLQWKRASCRNQTRTITAFIRSKRLRSMPSLRKPRPRRNQLQRRRRLLRHLQCNQNQRPPLPRTGFSELTFRQAPANNWRMKTQPSRRRRRTRSGIP